LNQQKKVEHLFRHEYGKLVALLLKKIGLQHLDVIEDAVQWAITQALESWRKDQIPKNPAAWLYQVAYRHLLSNFRSTKRKTSLLSEHFFIEENEIQKHDDIAFSGEMSDSMLRMLFVACNDSIPIESQMVFTLKSLCGFSIREIALRLFISEANVYKRFGRAKKLLKDLVFDLSSATDSEMKKSLSSVHRVLYLVFTEGYLSSHPDKAIRKDLCEEAVRLAELLTKSALGDVPDSYALLALMYFHLARLHTREDDLGALLLLENQDREKWDKQQIAIGMTYLAQSADGDTISRYHVEAGIAAEHCLSPSLKQTRWDNIVASYVLLERIAPSPLHLLNRAVAVAEWKGPEAGLAIFKSVEIPNWLSRTYYWYAVQADLLFRCGDNARGREYAELAIEKAPTDHIKQLLLKRLLKGDN
jgi:RNA polymerase sigma-70 factor (ECF subfamily)